MCDPRRTDDRDHASRPRHGPARRRLRAAEAAPRTRRAQPRCQAGALEHDRAGVPSPPRPHRRDRRRHPCLGRPIAERAVALGFYVNARPATVAAAAGSFPLGRVTDIETITELVELVELIDGVTATTRRILDPLASAGAVGHDITVGILEGLEKYRWMLTAQTS
jgi:hypothetical protein